MQKRRANVSRQFHFWAADAWAPAAKDPQSKSTISVYIPIIPMEYELKENCQQLLVHLIHRLMRAQLGLLPYQIRRSLSVGGTWKSIWHTWRNWRQKKTNHMPLEYRWDAHFDSNSLATMAIAKRICTFYSNEGLDLVLFGTICLSGVCKGHVLHSKLVKLKTNGCKNCEIQWTRIILVVVQTENGCRP